jgi:protein-tyrosine phosphatase
VSVWIELEGAHNVRDLGGLPAATGSTRPHVLLRADALDALTAADVAHVAERLNVRHVIDLRSPTERAERGRGLLEAAGTTYTEVVVVEDDDLARRRAGRSAAFASGVPPDQIMADGYVELLRLGAPAFVAALDRVLAPGGLPVLIHCAAGKDRTGVLVALLLDAAGVDRHAIVNDYAATQSRMLRVMERLRSADAYRSLAERLPAFVFDALPATMVRFLDELDRRWGGAEGYFAHHGVPLVALDRWRSLLVEPGVGR